MTRARNIANLGNNTTNLETLDALYGDNGLTGRNLIINGAMQVAQRGTSFADPNDNSYSLDRIHIFNSNDGAFTVTQDTTVPSGEGFYKSLKFDCTTIDGTIAAGQYATFSQRIEGFNNAVLGYGASGAKSITVSFYAKSNLTGTFCYSVRNDAVDRAYIKEFSLTSANTWERISFTIPGDTGGTWLTTNGIGSNHQICLSIGSDFHGTANQWNTSNVAATSNQVNFLSSTDNEFFLTGWQVEVGETATPFEHKSYADYEWDCQRYYHMVKEGSGTYMQFCTGRAWGTGGANGPYKFPRVMRASPTMTAGGAASDYDFSLSAVPAAGSVTLNNDMMMINISGSFTTGQIVIIGSNDVGSGPAALMFDAEL